MTDSQDARPETELADTTEADERVLAFWERARPHAIRGVVPAYMGPSPLESVTPPAWSFGATPEHADELLDLVLAGTKTATSGALWDYEAEDEPLPEVGTLSIVLDASGTPRALLETTDVQVVPFDEVDEEFARLEGEGDLSLAHWRRVHEEFFTEVADHDRGFAQDMPVVCEQFRVVYTD
ncbi:hypothetical protein N802_08320 [Knoellia sinensis KCTC 19936]|uniref:ASCH domain-containing protein n=1 Tax=Knoellia sinensis KCTC 19936 TaxID=1385520 RepID=A0A0A0JCP7_9MICO|nr:ASCH domain-containing protein [Knoellia sinensis]KGN33802.1 hypothetical protein N802_08320 [Knoellia sinensis KCTC 19936]